MTQSSLLKPLLLAAGLVFGVVASASPILPSYDNFGALPAANFGGSGIPNHSVAIDTVVDGNRTITLGLTATQRYSNPAVTNDGNGTFFAAAGGDIYSGSNSDADYARWNLGLYIDFAPNIAWLSSNPYTLSLLFDKDPASGNSVTSSYQLTPLLLNPLFSNDVQVSWNLGMQSFFGAGFDPDVDGEYSFALLLSKNGTELGRSAINVVVGNPPSAQVPDTGSVAILLGAALTTLGLVRRVRRN